MIYNLFSFSLVEIDCLTGDHVVLRTDIVMDLGESINPAIGQAYDIFSPIFPIPNLRIVSTKYYVIFVLIFSNAQNWGEKCLFFTNKEFFFF